MIDRTRITAELELLQDLEAADQAGAFVVFRNVNKEDDNILMLNGNWYSGFIKSLFPKPMKRDEVKTICKSNRFKYSIIAEIFNKTDNQWKITLDHNWN